MKKEGGRCRPERVGQEWGATVGSGTREQEGRAKTDAGKAGAGGEMSWSV
jgi:hypothetical protein